MVSATSKVTLDKSAVAGKYAYALMPTVPPGATALPAGGSRRDQHPVRRQPGGGQVHQEQGPGAGPGQACSPAPDQQDAYYKTFGDLPTNAEEAKKLQSDPALAAIVDSAGKSKGTPVQRRLEPGPAGAGQRGGAVDPEPVRGQGRRGGADRPCSPRPRRPPSRRSTRPSETGPSLTDQRQRSAAAADRRQWSTPAGRRRPGARPPRPVPAAPAAGASVHCGCSRPAALLMTVVIVIPLLLAALHLAARPGPVHVPAVAAAPRSSGCATTSRRCSESDLLHAIWVSVAAAVIATVIALPLGRRRRRWPPKPVPRARAGALDVPDPVRAAGVRRRHRLADHPAARRRGQPGAAPPRRSTRGCGSTGRRASGRWSSCRSGRPGR